MVGAVMSPTPTPPAGPSRRAALRIGLGIGLGIAAAGPLAVVLSACSGSEARDRLDAGVDRLEAPRRTPPAPPNPDQPAVDAVIGATLGLVSALRPLRGKDPVFADLVALHDAHLERLGAASGSGSGSASSATAAVSLDGSRAQVRAREHDLAGVLAQRAGSVQDGQLARLLAAMSAAVQQRVEMLS